jgi:hypothetical protein
MLHQLHAPAGPVGNRKLFAISLAGAFRGARSELPLRNAADQSSVELFFVIFCEDDRFLTYCSNWMEDSLPPGHAQDEFSTPI